jgi:cellulose synthase/poly-beta-1,6-N-acetylglucosamine synthase-like glycosyltransferase
LAGGFVKPDGSMAVILLVAGAVLLAAALHPFCSYPLSLMLMRRRKPQDAAGFDRPDLAICMSVFNESRVIVAKVQRLIEMAEAYGPASIHIYVDGAADDTVALLKPFEDRIDLVVSADRRGKTAGLKQLIQRSQSQLIAFTDANVVCEPDALVRLAGAMADPQVACVSPRLIYTNAEESGASLTGAAYWGLEEWIKQFESDTIGVIGVDGALFLIRRSAYEAPPDHLIDDFWVSLAVMAQGLRVVSAPDVVVSERSAVSKAEEFRRKARIACQALNVHDAMWPRIRRLPAPQLYGYISHRLLKWLMPFSLGLSLICFACAAVLLVGPWPVLAVFVLGVAMLLVGERLGVGLASAAIAAVTSLAGVGLGVLQSLFTRQSYTVWTPAASVRDN